MIDWHIGEHQDVTITEGSGLSFKWEGSIPHNVIEMTSKESVTSDCLFVSSATVTGKVTLLLVEVKYHVMLP